MDALPDPIFQLILSHISNARDVSACTCVSKQWRESIPFSTRLYFPRNTFDDKMVEPDAAIGSMISSALWLEELILYCPYSTDGLASWLSMRSQTLRHLELRIDGIVDRSPNEIAARLDCVSAAKGLETLKLWGVSMTQAPKWGGFERLHTLQIVGAKLMEGVLCGMFRACPNLKDLALLGCDGLRSISIELLSLEKLRLDFCGLGDSALSLFCPCIQQLEIQGCSLIHVGKNSLRSLSISNNSGKVCRVDMGGKLLSLEFLSIRGVQWCWNAVSSVLQCASEVKHLIMKIEFSGDTHRLQPFPEIDLVEFFNNHPKLQKFEIHGAMFAALCQKDSLKFVDERFTIPSLEEVLITVRSPLNAEQKMSTLESLVKHSRKLKKMVIRVTQMKNCHNSADEFFEEICGFRYENQRIVRIE